MAVLAVCRCDLSALVCDGVRAVRICGLRFSVAIGAGNLFRGRFVRETLHVLVAVDAGEHRAVHGLLQLFSIHEQIRLLAICFGRERLVGVASEAVFIFGLMFGASCEDPAKQK